MLLVCVRVFSHDRLTVGQMLSYTPSPATSLFIEIFVANLCYRCQGPFCHILGLPWLKISIKDVYYLLVDRQKSCRRVHWLASTCANVASSLSHCWNVQFNIINYNVTSLIPEGMYRCTHIYYNNVTLLPVVMSPIISCNRWPNCHKLSIISDSVLLIRNFRKSKKYFVCNFGDKIIINCDGGIVSNSKNIFRR